VSQVKEHTPTFVSSTIFTFGLTFESFKEFEGVSHGIRAIVELNPPIGSSNGTEKNYKLVHATIMGTPTQDIDVPSKTIGEEEQKDSEEQKDRENHDDHENEEKQPTIILFTLE